MKIGSRKVPIWLFVSALVLSLISAVALGRQLGSREARQKIAAAIGYSKSDGVHVKSISSGAGDTVVEASIDAAFLMSPDKEGNWVVKQVRTGDRCWEPIEGIRVAIGKEKALRTAADLRTLGTALEAYRREHGGYVMADSGAKLIDQLVPTYVASVIRLDAWSHEFQYHGTSGSYHLASAGPDGKPGTGDDIVLENGRIVKGGVDE